MMDWSPITKQEHPITVHSGVEMDQKYQTCLWHQVILVTFMIVRVREAEQQVQVVVSSQLPLKKIRNVIT